MAVQVEQATLSDLYRFTIEQYELMIERGIIKEDERVELVKGEILKMSPIGSQHEACVRRLTKLLERLAGDTAIVSVQMSVRLPDDSLSEPDVALLNWRDDFYAGGRATNKDVLLAIEVSDTSLNYDLNVKSRMYAEAGIADYWVVDLKSQVVHAFTKPVGGKYEQVQTLRRGTKLVIADWSERAFSADDVLG